MLLSKSRNAVEAIRLLYSRPSEEGDADLDSDCDEDVGIPWRRVVCVCEQI